ncbi:MAG: adenylate/guanylate cyclase domain-containing protein [Flavobacteriaceae bacterium]
MSNIYSLFQKRNKSLMWILLFLVFNMVSVPGRGQESQLDSLKVLLAQQAADTVKVNLLLEASGLLLRSQPDSAIAFAQEAIDLGESLGFKKGVGYGFKNIGIFYYSKGDFDDALAFWDKSLKAFEEIDFKLGISNMQSNIGAVYQTQGDDTKALEFFIQSLRNAEMVEDTIRIATAQLNIGTVYSNSPSTYDLAQEAYIQALPVWQKLDYKDGLFITYLNLGEIALFKGMRRNALEYLEQSLKYADKSNPLYVDNLRMIGEAYLEFDNYELSEEYLREAIYVAIKLKSNKELGRAYNILADNLYEQRKYEEARTNYEKSLDLAKTTEVYYDLANAYEGLTNVYAKRNDFRNAFTYQRQLAQIKDSIKNKDYIKAVSLLGVQFDLETKEKEISLLNADNNLKELQIEKDARSKQLLFIILGLFIAIIAGFVFQYFYVKKSNKKLAFERNRSERILLNILPKETAEELKENGFIKAKEFKSITVLFTDFKQFSVVAEHIPADDLVKSVDYYFKAFDEITERNNLEKIKTIGDAFMCAGGLPTENTTHAEDAYNAAVEILEFVKETEKNPPEGIHPFEIRIGLNSGPVVAGVVGTKKFQYDIWGSTVNIAARMESNSDPGRINVSENTYQLLKEKRKFTYRGEFEVKNKQLLPMYFVGEEEEVKA